jgi:predicted ATPase
LPLVLSFGTLGRGSALSGLGLQAEALEELRSGLTGWNGVGAHVMDTQWLCFIAAAHALAGAYAQAFSALDDAAKASADTAESHYLAELSRIKGTVLAETGAPAEAEALLYQAVETARAQQAKSLELRAATSLARLWRDQGKRTEARDLLAPVYGWFTEGFDTADLREARALLDELA